MSMTKKDFIALGDTVRLMELTPSQLEFLVDFCKSRNLAFKRERWLDYVARKCGPNGGKIK